MSAPTPRQGAGRPASSSHSTLEEAACELAFEMGWENVAAAEIARRAGVSRSSFFNYFGSKSDVLWRSVDIALDETTSLADFVARLEASGPPLALTHIDALGARAAASESAGSRATRLTSVLLRSPLESVATIETVDVPVLDRDVRHIRATAIAAGTIAAVVIWASAGIGRRPLHEYLAGTFGPQWLAA